MAMEEGSLDAQLRSGSGTAAEEVDLELGHRRWSLPRSAWAEASRLSVAGGVVTLDGRGIRSLGLRCAVGWAKTSRVPDLSRMEAAAVFPVFQAAVALEMGDYTALLERQLVAAAASAEVTGEWTVAALNVGWALPVALETRIGVTAAALGPGFRRGLGRVGLAGLGVAALLGVVGSGAGLPCSEQETLGLVLGWLGAPSSDERREVLSANLALDQIRWNRISAIDAAEAREFLEDDFCKTFIPDWIRTQVRDRLALAAFAALGPVRLGDDAHTSSSSCTTASTGTASRSTASFAQESIDAFTPKSFNPNQSYTF